MNFKRLNFQRRPVEEMKSRAQMLADELSSRRTVRQFSSDPIPLDVVHDAVRAAAQSPSGANKQPWTFVVVTDPQTKSEIRRRAEAEEREFYDDRAPQDWLDDLEQFGTDAVKAYLEEAPALIVIFAQTVAPDGSKHYYVKESVGIATGVLLSTLHLSGLGTLTYTPSPMKFLAELLDRPSNERPFLLVPVGYPAEDCEVPDIHRKPLEDVIIEL